MNSLNLTISSNDWTNSVSSYNQSGWDHRESEKTLTWDDEASYREPNPKNIPRITAAGQTKY